MQSPAVPHRLRLSPALNYNVSPCRARRPTQRRPSLPLGHPGRTIDSRPVPFGALGSPPPDGWEHWEALAITLSSGAACWVAVATTKRICRGDEKTLKGNSASHFQGSPRRVSEQGGGQCQASDTCTSTAVRNLDSMLILGLTMFTVTRGICSVKE